MKKQQQLTSEMITPELAAKIVKDYLLPMLENKPSKVIKDSTWKDTILDELKLTD